MSVQNLGVNDAGITTFIKIGQALLKIVHCFRAFANSEARNEPDFTTPYLYNYINKQAKSVKRSRSLANQ